MEGGVLHNYFMTTVLSKQRPLSKRVRRHNGVIQKRRYGKWYDQEQLDSLAAYKFNTFGNPVDLKDTRDYTEWDVNYIQPTFRWTDNNRGIIAPTGFFKYLMEECDLGSLDYVQAAKLFVPHRINHASEYGSYTTNHGDMYGMADDDWYPFPDSVKYLQRARHYTHLPFICDDRYNYIEFTLRQGVFVKWDDDLEKRIASMVIEIDDEVIVLDDCNDLMNHLVEPEII